MEGGGSRPWTDARIDNPNECTDPLHSRHDGYIWCKAFGGGPITAEGTGEEPGDGQCSLDGEVDYNMDATGPGSATGHAWGQCMIDGTWGDESVLLFEDPDEDSDSYSAEAEDNSIFSPSSYKVRCQAKSRAQAGPKSDMGTAHAEVDYSSVEYDVTVEPPE
ncbi:MAG: hypothetical protein PVH68_15610 [Armatimonadota bacterium]